LAKDAPVIGLLFGFQEGLEITIFDAEEIEYASVDPSPSSTIMMNTSDAEIHQKQHKQRIQTKIDLHQKVFPKHEVIGWYRVGDDLAESDLQINNHAMKEYNECPLFVLVNPNPDDDAKELPISIYETLVTMETSATSGAQQPRTVFVGLDFELNTAEAERIAVEKVFKAQATDGESGLDVHLQSITESIESMNTRVAVLLDFLRKTQRGEIPPDHKLLRQVDGLLRQLPVFANKNLSKEFNHEYDDMLLVSYLASIAKTTKAIQGYSEKFRIAHESNTNSREMRRAY